MGLLHYPMVSNYFRLIFGYLIKVSDVQIGIF